MDHSQQPIATERQFSPGNWVLIGFLAIAAFFLWTEHRAHLLGILPFLLLLACPLMHLFHHRHHGQHKSKLPPAADNPASLEPVREAP
jgi:hypothetical protein